MPMRWRHHDITYQRGSAYVVTLDFVKYNIKVQLNQILFD